VTLRDADTIDYLCLSKDRTSLSMIVADDLDWEDERSHIALLQAKVNRYLDCVESGEVFRLIADAAGGDVGPMPVRIDIYLEHEPPGLFLSFLAYTGKVAEELGARLAHKVLK
jgi:hypothetical protein